MSVSMSPRMSVRMSARMPSRTQWLVALQKHGYTEAGQRLKKCFFWGSSHRFLYGRSSARYYRYSFDDELSDGDILVIMTNTLL